MVQRTGKTYRTPGSKKTYFASDAMSQAFFDEPTDIFFAHSRR